MINFKKLKSQIHRAGMPYTSAYVFEATEKQIADSDWEIFSIGVEGSKRRLIKVLVDTIHMKGMDYWRKEFLL